jgi:2-polyprenyl-6-methoxyphenol hydroxylase-like FAD-dependent oxidoreductase
VADTVKGTLGVVTPEQGRTAVGEPVRVALGSGRTLSTKLLVGADGPGSVVKRDSAVSTVGWPYNQRGVVMTVTTSAPSSTVRVRSDARASDA